MKIMQGDSYPLYFKLTIDGDILTPHMISELEICIGNSMRKLYSKDEVKFDLDTNSWYIWPTQDETLEMEIGQHSVVVRIKYRNSTKNQVQGYQIGRINVIDTISEEVI